MKQGSTAATCNRRLLIYDFASYNIPHPAGEWLSNIPPQLTMSFDTARSASLVDGNDVQDPDFKAVIHGEPNTLDVALTLAGDAGDAPVPPQLSHRIRRKIDLHILPLLFLIYTGASSFPMSCTLWRSQSFWDRRV